ncbi:hypothetical protein BN2476_500096 [Paraburkholderia piptadeniae]|uniref:Uncharacterized protein n=1 Tax=Paraburkholderia piptadeniae TaxID=1701573 RepID=A0A1N7SFT6_9BURK|nr:hypothetical protein BN2476_500096 [Paraburkholderia piptadeniae]
MLDLYPRALNGPILHAATYWPMFVASALLKRLTCIVHPNCGLRHRTVQRPFAANCV